MIIKLYALKQSSGTDGEVFDIDLDRNAMLRKVSKLMQPRGRSTPIKMTERKLGRTA